MSRCRFCHQDGLVFLRYRESPGYDVASCVCDRGKWWRTKYQLRAWAATQDPKPEQIGRLEEFFTEAELRVLVTTEGPDPGWIGSSRIRVPASGVASVGGSEIANSDGGK